MSPFVPPDVLQQHVPKKEVVPTEQQLCNQDNNSSLKHGKPESPQIKEEPEELCSSQEGDQLLLKHKAQGIITWSHQMCVNVFETFCKPEIKLHSIGI